MRRSGEGWPEGMSRGKGLEAGIGLGGLRSACRVGGGLVARDELQDLRGFPSHFYLPEDKEWDSGPGTVSDPFHELAPH